MAIAHEHCYNISPVLVFKESLRLPHKPLHSLIDDSQVFAFHLVVQEAVANKLSSQFWNSHILIQHSLYTDVS